MNITEYLGVALASTIKFVGGPIAGVALKLTWWGTALASTTGMMFTVIIIIYGGGVFSYLSQKLGNKKPRKKFTTTIKFGVKVKRKLGLWGISFLTPLLFTPILGSFLVLAFRYNKLEIIYKMTVCGFFWGAIQFFVFQSIGNYITK